ncbi:spore germination protein GerPC [Cytobacillus purgationiresistens]|uniref:Spore germination protein PC n=1 Tax=Cytobacillus purgationiresistens TaxID=863449 RepID=A0ABU0AC15_9BACI|nr:spore germination protein GerPC [Cytobacillus purgationiresistens]MDQ0268793.1 spore germination protein PC [Cytobacillus purgationiresistens]
MNQDIYGYLHQLQAYIQNQDKRIENLEKKFKKLQDESLEYRDKQPIHIDKIEYKFDQLKVESLEGTLNIGLNPSDFQDIDDFSVDNKEMNTPASPKNLLKRNIEIENEMYRFIEADLPQIVAEAEAKLNMASGESYTEFIKEDVRKQLSKRIDFYLKQQPIRQSADDHLHQNEEVIQQLKKEIANGVHAFLSHLPENMKGTKQE